LSTLQRHSQNLSGFIRRAALEKLDQLGVPAEKEGLGDLLDETRDVGENREGKFPNLARGRTGDETTHRPDVTSRQDI